MNRPLKRKLTNAVMAFLEAAKAGTPFAGITFVTGAGTTLAAEVAHDAETSALAVAEPLPPFLAIDANTQADPDLPGVAAFELVLHLKTDATAPDADRLDTDAILRAIYDTLIAPPNDAAAFDDANKEFGALRTFINKPGTDNRPTYRKPLHLYSMWHTTAPTLFDDENWHDQLVFAGHAQDMDDS